MTRPPQRWRPMPGDLLLVAAGGMIGTLLRALLSAAWPGGGALMVENVLGALLLGALTEVLAACGPETPRTRRVRLALGTGVLGGFTTFSALALMVHTGATSGQMLPALGYGIGSLLAGAIACVAGIALAARLGAFRRDADGPHQGPGR